MVGILIRCVFALFCLSFGAVGGAAPRAIADPMRPPPGVAADADATAEEAGAPQSPVLQSVIVPRTGKPIAIIGGQQVRLGEKFGESRLVRLNERSAVLEGPGGVEHLLLTPQVEKVDEKRSENKIMAVAKSGRRGESQ